MLSSCCSKLIFDSLQEAKKRFLKRANAEMMRFTLDAFKKDLCPVLCGL